MYNCVDVAVYACCICSTCDFSWEPENSNKKLFGVEVQFQSLISQYLILLNSNS